MSAIHSPLAQAHPNTDGGSERAPMNERTFVPPALRNKEARLATSPESGTMRIFVFGVVLLVLGIAFNLYNAPKNGQDFAGFWFPAAQRLAARQNPYVLSGNVFRLHEAERGLIAPIVISANPYPPLVSALAIPLVPLGKTMAQYTFLLGSLSVLALGLWRFLSVATPHWSRALRMFGVGVAMSAGSVRWSSVQYQFTILTVGLICLAVHAELNQRQRSVILFGVLAVKSTLVLPLIALLLFRRRIATVAWIGALSLGLNLALLAWTGFAESYAGWRLNLAHYVVVNGQNYPSLSTLIAHVHGDPALASQPPGVLMPAGFDYLGLYPGSTHWTLLFTAFTPSLAVAQRWSFVLSASCALLLAWLGFRLRDRRDDRETLMRWFAAWTCLGMLCVTHLKYDLLALVPVCYLALGLALKTHRRADRALAVLAFVPAFCLTDRWVTQWVTDVAIPLRQYWLVPVYVLLATFVFSAALWGLGGHLRTADGARRNGALG